MTHVRDREIGVISRRVGLYALRHNLSTLTLSHWVTLWVALTVIQCYEPIISHPLMGGPRTNTTLYGDLKGDLKSYLSLNWGK